jgi:hypothetical protein
MSDRESELTPSRGAIFHALLDALDQAALVRNIDHRDEGGAVQWRSISFQVAPWAPVPASRQLQNAILYAPPSRHHTSE